MKVSPRVLPLSLTLLLLSFTSAQAQEISLFNGRDLSGWRAQPEYWTVVDGAITGQATSRKLPPEQTDLIWEGGLASDFELHCKARMTDAEGSGFCNSGIYCRAHLVNPALFRISGYQGDLVLNSRMPTILGAFAGEMNAKEKMFTKTGQSVLVRAGGAINVIGSVGDDKALLKGFRDQDWNDYRVLASGTRIQFFINGRLTSEVVDERPEAPRSGLLGFQMLARKPMVIQYKDIKLRLLKPLEPFTIAGSAPSSAPAASALSTVQIDPNQPRIQVVKDQGPNATEWALTPLNETIPADVRQNLTYLREDLLDEGHKSPKAAAEAYAIASDYCDKILSALSQREIARVNAGYSAAQADASKTISNQALDARRNYKMSWPQYAREESQRAALRDNESDKADVKKERLKVEWTSRAEQMRAHLDASYRKLRGAMR